MKKRSLSGNVGVGIFVVAFICVCVAFGTPAWLVSDARITGAPLDKLGLWSHCFRSLPDPLDGITPSRFYVGCRWVYDPFTAGYSEIRGFLLPPFMVTTQVFYTICFLAFLISLILVLLYTLCSSPEQRRYVEIIMAIGYILLIGSTCGCIAVIVFACLGNTDGWMPGHANNFFGWSFVIGIVGSVLGLIAAALFFVEANIHRKKRNYLKESQMRFKLETHT